MFIELKIKNADQAGNLVITKRLVNVNEVVQITKDGKGNTTVFMKEYPSRQQGKDQMKHALYNQALVVGYMVANDYSDFRKDLAGLSVYEPDSKELNQVKKLVTS